MARKSWLNKKKEEREAQQEEKKLDGKVRLTGSLADLPKPSRKFGSPGPVRRNAAKISQRSYRLGHDVITRMTKEEEAQLYDYLKQMLRNNYIESQRTLREEGVEGVRIEIKGPVWALDEIGAKIDDLKTAARPRNPMETRYGDSVIFTEEFLASTFRYSSASYIDEWYKTVTKKVNAYARNMQDSGALKKNDLDFEILKDGAQHRVEFRVSCTNETIVKDVLGIVKEAVAEAQRGTPSTNRNSKSVGIEITPAASIAEKKQIEVHEATRRLIEQRRMRR